MRTRTGRGLSAESAVAQGIPESLNLDRAKGQCGSTCLIPFGTQPWHASMFRGTGSLGSLSILRIAGAHGAEPHAGFWVLLGGPKVPPRRVLKTGNERRISTRIAIMVRRRKDNNHLSFNPTFHRRHFCGSVICTLGACDSRAEPVPPRAPSGLPAGTRVFLFHALLSLPP